MLLVEGAGFEPAGDGISTPYGLAIRCLTWLGQPSYVWGEAENRTPSSGSQPDALTVKLAPQPIHCLATHAGIEPT